MATVNRVILVGNICKDFDLKRTPSGVAVVNLILATNESRKDKDGQKKQFTEYHRVTLWKELAENTAKYMSKGSQMYIEGRIQSRSYDKDGQKHYVTDIIADKGVFLNSGERDHSAGGPKQEAPPKESTPPADDDWDGPF